MSKPSWNGGSLETSRLEIVRLAEGNTMRTAILRAVSHDLRTPLAGIKLAAGGLLQDGSATVPEEQERELLETIDECSDRLDGLVGNLLDMSRITAQSVEPLLEPVRWQDAWTAPSATCPAGAVAVALPANMPAVEADPGLLERVVANIVENALKYAPGTGMTVIRYHRWQLAGAARAAILPASCASSTTARVFRPARWWRCSSRSSAWGTRTQGTGIGLGLAVAQGFVAGDARKPRR